MIARRCLDTKSKLFDSDEELQDQVASVFHYSDMSTELLGSLREETGICGYSWYDLADQPNHVYARAWFEIEVTESKFGGFIPTRQQDVEFLIGSNDLKHVCNREAQILPFPDTFLLKASYPFAFSTNFLSESEKLKVEAQQGSESPTLVISTNSL